jgi:endonuclease-3 related protein
MHRVSCIDNSMSDRTLSKRLIVIYKTLYEAYGPQHWWPGDTPFEVMVGAVLTQNTAWANVEKAIANLKRGRLLTVSRLNDTPGRRLASLIRPSGYFNIKARRLKSLTAFVVGRYRGNLKRMFADEPRKLREGLLGVNGIGPETADSILLYAANRPYFVVDAYTKRVFSRHGFVSEKAVYHQVQRLFMENLRADALLYNEYHALIVRVGKERCKKSRPLCSGCPLEKFLPS